VGGGPWCLPSRSLQTSCVRIATKSVPLLDNKASERLTVVQVPQLTIRLSSKHFDLVWKCHRPLCEKDLEKYLEFITLSSKWQFHCVNTSNLK